MTPPLTGQIALTASQQQLDASDLAGGVTAFAIKAPRSNAAAAFVGPAGVTASTGYQLDPGDEITYERVTQSGQPFYQMRLSEIWAVGTGGDKVTWLGLR